MLPPIGRGFYQRTTREVASDLLGKLIVRKVEREFLVVRIIETEAYLGVEDAACHTFGGRRTARTETMWGEAGFAYVYLIYGIHHCLNVVTVGPEDPQAVLIRAVTPISGTAKMREWRGSPSSDKTLCDGPGKLCQALGITRRDDGVDLTVADSSLTCVDDGFVVPTSQIRKRPRVGVDYAGMAAEWPLRFNLVES